MGTKLYVYSTLASDVIYTNHAQGGADLPIVVPDPVLIKGGAGVANDRFVTPRGVMTPVTEEQVAYLRDNQVFKLHEQNGFVVIDDKVVDVDKVVADMNARDNSAPLVPPDLPADLQPTQGDPEDDAAPTPRKRK